MKSNEKLINDFKNNLSNNSFNEINKEAGWNYIKLENSKQKEYLIDFEIIDYDTYSLLENQKINTNNFMLVSYFIYSNIIFILIKNI